jgi:hypothetical protein
MFKTKRLTILLSAVAVGTFLFIGTMAFIPRRASAATPPPPSTSQPQIKTGDPVPSGDKCGGGDGNATVDISINIGCQGKGNPIIDMLFAAIRFLTAGVGIVVVGSVIVAGIQYTASRGDPNGTAAAIKRITSAFVALLIYIFAAAILNFVIPAGVLK